MYPGFLAGELYVCLCVREAFKEHLSDSEGGFLDGGLFIERIKEPSGVLFDNEADDVDFAFEVFVTIFSED